MRSPAPEHDVAALALILHDLQRRLEQDRRAEGLSQHLRQGSEVLRHTERLEASGLKRGRRDQHCAGLQPGHFADFEVLLGLQAGSRNDGEELGRRALGRARRIYHDRFGSSRACVWEIGKIGDGRDLVIQQLQLLGQGAFTAMLAAKGREHLLRQHRARHCT